MKTAAPFFIVGTPRSGTTLLQAMLMSIPGVFIPPETKFYAITAGREAAFGPLTDHRGFELALKAILASIPASELPADPAELEQALRTGEHTHAAMFDELLWHMQQRHAGCRRIGEKSPPHLLFVPRILTDFPDSKVITIIRDGRDVSISQAQAWKSNVLRVAISWQRDQRLHASYARQFPGDRYTSVRYEDLVTDPEPELRRLCEFLGENYTDAMLAHHTRNNSGFAARETHKARTLEPVTASRVQRYRKSLNRSEIALFQAIAGSELQRNGYELERIPRALGIIAALKAIPATLRTRRELRRKIRAEANRVPPADS